MPIWLVSLAIGVMAPLAFAAAGENFKVSSETFQSGGHTIAVDVFHPSTPGVHPAMLVLYGAGGLVANNGYIRQLAPVFVTCGFETYLVHYFDRTGDSWASDDQIHANFEAWISAISDAVSFIVSHPQVDRARIATFGFSLGAYLAVAHAARDPRVRAVIELSGGMDPFYASRAEHMPPLLILHGEEDHRVDVDRARELEALMRKLGTPYEIRLYPQDGHVLRPASTMDAILRGMAFLKRYVPGEQPSADGPGKKTSTESPPGSPFAGMPVTGGIGRKP